MTISQLPSGKFRAQVYYPPKKRAVSVAQWNDGVGSFKTLGQAKKAIKRAEVAIANERGQSRMTIAEWRELWLKTGVDGGWKMKTAKVYRESTEKLVEIHGDVALVDFTPDMAVKWMAEHRWTVPNARLLFSRAATLGLIERTPFRGLGVVRPKRQLRPGFLEEADVDRLAERAMRVYQDFGPVPAGMILVSAWTCVRPGELFELRRGDVDFKEGVLHVYRQATIEGTTKKEDVRVVTLHPRAADAIRAAMPVVDGLGGGDLLFCTTRGTRWSAPAWHHRWDKIRSGAGRDDLVYYDLRHFGATWLLEQGVSVEDVAHQMGHQDGGKEVVRTYGHPNLAHSRERIRAAFAAADRRQASTA